MIAFKRTFTDTMPARVESGLESAGITTLHGQARFSGRNAIKLNDETLFAMAMGAGMTANKIKAMIFAYPSYASDIGSMV